MARPVEFDRAKALDNAIKVFARHGYEAASTSDLLAAMGIARQSLYSAFGDKRRLFLEALRIYSDNSLQEMRDAMANSASVSAGLEEALLVGLGSSADIETGCLGVGSIVEFSRTDDGINQLNDAASEAVLKMFHMWIRKGIAQGEFASHIEPRVAARFMLTLRSGLKVAARGGATSKELRSMARLAVAGLRP